MGQLQQSGSVEIAVGQKIACFEAADIRISY
jgi:hypothetical protein